MLANHTNRRVKEAPRAVACCTECAICHLCMPHGLEAAVLPKFAALVVAGRTVRAGETLYFPGDRFQSLYAVRSGSLKTFVTNREGREQITGLGLPGGHWGSTVSQAAYMR